MSGNNGQHLDAKRPVALLTPLGLMQGHLSAAELAPIDEAIRNGRAVEFGGALFAPGAVTVRLIDAQLSKIALPPAGVPMVGHG